MGKSLFVIALSLGLVSIPLAAKTKGQPGIEITPETSEQIVDWIAHGRNVGWKCEHFHMNDIPGASELEEMGMNTFIRMRDTTFDPELTDDIAERARVRIRYLQYQLPTNFDFGQCAQDEIAKFESQLMQVNAALDRAESTQ
ncbi:MULTISPECIES: hypothetical protein [Gammaproteobacteria]|uniref:hypothetical protein n=1 Tax=Gammaproteobacteria TaxID=1236 RepID=UPI000DD0EA9F|nr:MULTISPECIES: hypothetical protein [Gammaproteobacteria]RTE86530.1 hypothetical protein DQX04_08210 [Aliidiomarina sp. B3213]TCZ90915.1 hypothetical protein EYQ95_08835 [Lysobacter sp. N42]